MKEEIKKVLQGNLKEMDLDLSSKSFSLLDSLDIDGKEISKAVDIINKFIEEKSVESIESILNPLLDGSKEPNMDDLKNVHLKISTGEELLQPLLEQVPIGVLVSMCLTHITANVRESITKSIKMSVLGNLHNMAVKTGQNGMASMLESLIREEMSNQNEFTKMSVSGKGASNSVFEDILRQQEEGDYEDDESQDDDDFDNFLNKK